MVMCLGLLEVLTVDMLTSRMTPHGCRHQAIMVGFACALYPLSIMAVICHDLQQHYEKVEGAPLTGQ